MNNVSNICRIYESLAQEFKQSLERELTKEEQSFLKWVAQKVSNEMSK